jgi:hypothetical protein
MSLNEAMLISLDKAFFEVTEGIRQKIEDLERSR